MGAHGGGSTGRQQRSAAWLGPHGNVDCTAVWHGGRSCHRFGHGLLHMQRSTDNSLRVPCSWRRRILRPLQAGASAAAAVTACLNGEDAVPKGGLAVGRPRRLLGGAELAVLQGHQRLACGAAGGQKRNRTQELGLPSHGRRGRDAIIQWRRGAGSACEVLRRALGGATQQGRASAAGTGRSWQGRNAQA